MHCTFRFLAVLVLLAMNGCSSATVALRPDGSPGLEECSQEALRTMNIMQLYAGDESMVELAPRQADRSMVTLHDGPIEVLLAQPWATFDPGTRLFGKVWTTGPTVVIRFYEAHSPLVGTMPICAVVRYPTPFLKKLPESKPGTAILKVTRVPVVAVDVFR
jgi:hypothetical protein